MYANTYGEGASTRIGQGSGWTSSNNTHTSAARNAMDETAAVAVLQHVETKQLEGLLAQEDQMYDLVNDLQQVKNLQLETETLLAENKSMAQHNLSFDPKLIQLKIEVTTGYESLARLKEVFENNKARLEGLCQQQSLETTHALLQTKSAEVEERTEGMSENFIEGKEDHETFISNFLEQRTEAHLLRVKAEKMGEIIRNQNQPTRQAATPQSGPAWGAPYNPTAVPSLNNYYPPK